MLKGIKVEQQINCMCNCSFSFSLSLSLSLSVFIAWSGVCCVAGLGSGDSSAGNTDTGAAAVSRWAGEGKHGSDQKTVCREAQHRGILLTWGPWDQQYYLWATVKPWWQTTLMKDMMDHLGERHSRPPSCFFLTAMILTGLKMEWGSHIHVYKSKMSSFGISC